MFKGLPVAKNCLRPDSAPLIKSMPPESFWVLKIQFVKKNVEHLQNERV